MTIWDEKNNAQGKMIIKRTSQNTVQNVTNSRERSTFSEARRVLSLSRYSPHFMEPEGSLPLSQKPTSCTYLAPDQFSPYPHPTSLRLLLIQDVPTRAEGLKCTQLPFCQAGNTEYLTSVICQSCDQQPWNATLRKNALFTF